MNREIYNYFERNQLPTISGEKLVNGILHSHANISLKKLENLHKKNLLKKEELEYVLSNIRKIFIWCVEPGITDLSNMHIL